jgi:hypothetical protein
MLLPVPYPQLDAMLHAKPQTFCTHCLARPTLLLTRIYVCRHYLQSAYTAQYEWPDLRQTPPPPSPGLVLLFIFSLSTEVSQTASDTFRMTSSSCNRILKIYRMYEFMSEKIRKYNIPLVWRTRRIKS